MKMQLLAAAAMATVGLMAADGYGIRNPAWALAPDAERLLEEWSRIPYARKNGRTDIFVRAQLKYGINRSDYIHHWYDRPLLQDSSLGQRQDIPTDPAPWLNPGSWAKTVEMGRLGKQTGFAVFTFTSYGTSAGHRTFHSNGTAAASPIPAINPNVMIPHNGRDAHCLSEPT